MNIKISNIKTYLTNKNIARVTFTQRFRSDQLSDIGFKELFLKKETNGWKIIKETWEPL